MKRSAMPHRRTPLTANTELKRTPALGHSPLARSALHAGSAARRAAPKRASTSSIPAKVRAALKLRSGGMCEMALSDCTGQAVDPAHRVRTGMGGRKGAAKAAHDVLSNLIHACRRCHSWTHAQPTKARQLGLMLRDGDNPIAEPVLYRGAWLWLLDDGSVSTINPDAEEATVNSNYVQQLIRDLSDRLPDCDMDLIDLYVLLALTRGTETTLEDVHSAWAIWRNTSNPEHRSLVPFDQLSREVQELDRKYMEAVHEAAKAAA